MNTTMAPIEQGRQGNLVDLKRRYENMDEASIEKREAQGGGGDGKRGNFDGRFGPNGDQKDRGDGGSSGKDSGNGGGGNDKGGGGGGGGKNSLESSDEASSEATTTTQTPPSNATVIASTTAPISVTSIASTTTPTSVSVTSTTAPGLAAAPSTTPLALTPTTVIPIPTLTPFTSPPDSSSQPRKGLNTNDDGDSKTDTRSFKGKPTSTSQSIVPIAESVLAPTSTALALPTQTHNHGHKSAPLSPVAEHLLIAAGVIGACIIVIAGVYLLTRMMKIDVLSPFRNRGFRRGSKGWPGWRRRSKDLTSLEPPKYPGQDGSYGYPSDEKSIPPQRQLDAFFSPVAIPPLANPQTAATLSQADPQRQDQVREALLNNPAPFGASPASQRQPSAQQTQPFTQSLQQNEHDYNNTYNSNNTYNTNTTSVSRNTSDAYDPAQREVNHLSYLSSLSSGFGDAQIIIPESGPTKSNNQAPRQSSHQSRKFSWVSSVPGFRRQDDRDTVYTTASIESAPRYRTVNSWVAQQSNRVDRRLESDREVPNMPEIPLPLQIGIDHQRKASEDPAFKHHPGDEIEVRKGIRIPSSILDRNTGFN